MSSRFQGNRASALLVFALEDKHVNSKYLHAPFSYCWAQCHMVYDIGIYMEYPFRPFGSFVLAVSPHKLLPSPSLLAFGGGIGETALMLYSKHWCAINTIPTTKHSSMKATIEKVKSITVTSNIKIHFFVHKRFCNNHHPLRQRLRQNRRKIVSIV